MTSSNISYLVNNSRCEQSRPVQRGLCSLQDLLQMIQFAVLMNNVMMLVRTHSCQQEMRAYSWPCGTPPRCIIPSFSCLSLSVSESIVTLAEQYRLKGLPKHWFDTRFFPPKGTVGVCGEVASLLNCTIRPQKKRTHEYSCRVSAGRSCANTRFKVTLCRCSKGVHTHSHTRL